MCAGVHRSVWNKIRSDFRRDRSAKVHVDMPLDDGHVRRDELWEECERMLVDAVNVALVDALAAYATETARCVAQKGTPSWSSFGYAALKQSIAITQQQCGLIEQV